jgi:Fe-S cluster assembly protein SufD
LSTASLPAQKQDALPESFARLARRPIPESGGLTALRRAALDRFRERGLPTTRDEDWRFTSLAPLARTSFEAADPAPLSTTESRRWAAELAAEQALPAAACAVFVDGCFAPALSRLDTPGVVIASLRERLAAQPAFFEPILGRLLGDQPGAFADLNTALFEDGALVEILPQALVPEPLQLLFLSTGAAVARLPRVLVLARPGSEATLVETYAGSGGAASFTGAVTEILVEENAVLRRYKLQNEAAGAFHLSALGVRVGRNGRFHDFSVSLGAALSRHDLKVALAAEGAEASLDGLFFADGERHTDTHTIIDHIEPHGTSRQTYKGIVAGRGRGVFTGRVIVRKGAQKTDAAQSNQNLLLSREALVHSTPQLEILADDVKCRHGATTGQLDEAAVFYLRSRGLSEAAARGLLTVAFAADLVHKIAVPALRERVSALLLAKLPGVAEAPEAPL